MPGNTCFLCKTTWKQSVSMFVVPSDDYLRSEWQAACGVLLPPNSRICAKHFAAKDFAWSSELRPRLQPDAVPTLNIPPTATIRIGENCKKNRATMEQLLYYVNFARRNPIMMTSKFRAVNHLWEQLANALNAMDGVQRSPDKWKENLGTWRSQVRCRARQGIGSGVPEFDEFAAFDFGQETLKRTTQDVDEVQVKRIRNPRESYDLRLPKEVQNELDNEKEDPLIPEVVVQFKNEINCSDDDDSFPHILTAGRNEFDTEADITIKSESTTDIKTELDIEDNDSANSEVKNIPAKKLPVLGFTSDEPSRSVPHKDPIATAPTNSKTVPHRPHSTSNATDIDKETFLVETENETFIVEDITTAAAPSSAPQESESSMRSAISLSKMYDLVLNKMQKRDERSDEMMNVLKDLTVAVRALAYNVKRLEEKLTFRANDQ